MYYDICMYSAGSVVHLLFCTIRWVALCGQILGGINGWWIVCGAAHIHWRNIGQQVSRCLSLDTSQSTDVFLLQRPWQTVFVFQSGSELWRIDRLYNIIVCAIPCHTLCRCHPASIVSSADNTFSGNTATTAALGTRRGCPAVTDVLSQLRWTCPQ